MRSDSTFLVLGAKGFIGSNLLNFLKTKSINAVGIDQHITKNNVKHLFTDGLLKNSIVINCIAKGVTPTTETNALDLSVNSEFIEPILLRFIASEGTKFIHLATKYELDSINSFASSRLQYVHSKEIGSAIVRKYIKLDPRIFLLYLPTILKDNQTKGRFFIDFLSKGFRRLPFEIYNPYSEIRVASFETFSSNILEISRNNCDSINSVPDGGKMQVIEFAFLLNTLLVKNNYPPVKLIINGKRIAPNLHINLNAVDSQFIIEIEKYITVIAKDLL